MASSQTHLKKRLESLECHFTWNLDKSKRSPRLVLERLEGVCDSGECDWQGHLYNLMGYYYYMNDSTEEALKYLIKAEVILREQDAATQPEAEGRGPRLLVNQANLAWVHYLLGELPESEAYLEKVAQLQKDFPAPPGCDLHPEVYGEKGWTQMKLEDDMKKKAIANFEMALRGDPNRKEWNSGLAVAKYKVYFGAGNKSLNEEIIELIKHAKKVDPDSLRMSALYLVAVAAVGRKTKETVKEAYKLFPQLKPNCDGFEDIFHFFRMYVSPDSALHLAEEAVRKYPSEKRAKRQLAICYRRKISESWRNRDQELMRKAIEISEEVATLYPRDCRPQISVAVLYAQAGNKKKADEIYKGLLSKEDDLEPQDLQLLYSRYAKYPLSPLITTKKLLKSKCIHVKDKIALIFLQQLFPITTIQDVMKYLTSCPTL